MNTKSIVFNPDWVDPDDAPELTKEWFESASYMIGGHEVSKDIGIATLRAQAKRGRPIGSTKPNPKQQATLRFDADVLNTFRASGKGWQRRIDLALKDWLKTHRPEEMA